MSTHPYFPPDADIPHYIPNATPVYELVAKFASLLGTTIFTTLWLATRCNPHMRSSEKFIFGWFVLCKSFVPFVLAHRSSL
jgi:cholestenol Delta-isomerase